MAASVNIVDEAFSDLRFDRLGALLGTNKYDALGRMAHLWRACTSGNTYELPTAIVSLVIPLEALVTSGLGERVSCPCCQGDDEYPCTADCDPVVRIKGTEGRVEWLDEKRKAAKAGGLARAASAKRTSGGRFAGRGAGPAEPATPGTSEPAPSSATATATATATAIDRSREDSEDTSTRGQASLPISPPQPKRKSKLDGVPVREITKRVIGAFNEAFDRSLTCDGWGEAVTTALKQGASEKQLRAVIWWAASEWEPGDPMRKGLTPKTLFKRKSPQGYRTFPEYLSCAAELWRETHNNEDPPWETEANSSKT
jgi:hypothetical protein